LIVGIILDVCIYAGAATDASGSPIRLLLYLTIPVFGFWVGSLCKASDRKEWERVKTEYWKVARKAAGLLVCLLVVGSFWGSLFMLQAYVTGVSVWERFATTYCCIPGCGKKAAGSADYRYIGGFNFSSHKRYFCSEHLKDPPKILHH
jgi:hypothetical protein